MPDSQQTIPAWARGFTPTVVGGDAPSGPLRPPQQAAQPPLSEADHTDPSLPYKGQPDYGYGPRYASQAPKGLGYFGPLTPTRANTGDVMGEYSISPMINGRRMEVPSIVPTLSREELQSVLALPRGANPSPVVQQKAADFARQRLANGLPVFARAGEQDLTTYPDIPRQAAPPARPQAPPLASSHQPRPVVGPQQPVQPVQPPQQSGQQPPLAPSHTPAGGTIGAATPQNTTLTAPTWGDLLGGDRPLTRLSEYLVPKAVGDTRRSQAENLVQGVMASPQTGAARMQRGATTLAHALPAVSDMGPAPTASPAPPNLRNIARGTSDVVGGGMEAATMLVPGALAKAPLQVGGALLTGTGADTAVRAAGQRLGIPPEYVDLAAQAAGLAAGGKAHEALGTPEVQAAVLDHARRLYSDQSGELRLPGVGTPPPEPPVEAPAEETPEAPGVAEARSLFPRMDKYGKPSGRLTGPTILKRLDANPDVSPEARDALTQLASQVGSRRISADELQAMSRGETYTPDRILRKVAAPVEGGPKQIPGAPLGITNARQERGLRERYIGGMERGVGGRDWYEDAGNSILFHANDDPTRANLLAGDLAITSPTTTVSANSGFGVKGYNQATAGVPVEAGRFPTAMGKAIEEAHAEGGGATGLKRSPFQQNLARGGGFLLSTDPPRAVHDIWNAEGHGFANPDGSPMRTGFGPAQHRWMDRQQDKIIATANQRGVSGFTDWDELRSQAAKWTGQQIDAGVLDPKDAAQSYADHLVKLYAQGSRETVPGETTGHMPELLKPGMEEFRQLLHDIMVREGGIYDPQMRDQLAAGYGGLPGRAFEGPGLYEGRVSPGMQTQVLTGSQKVPGGPTGARMLDEGSRRIMDAAEATHGLAMGQDASAWSRLLPAGSGAPRGLWDVTLPGGKLTNAQMQALATRFPNIGEMAVIPTPEGVRLGAMDAGTMKSITKMLGGQLKESGAGLDTNLASNYLPNNWRQQRVGQGYFDPIQTMGVEKFNAFAPETFDKIRKADAFFRRETGGRFTLSPVLDEVRGTIANEGWPGLQRLAKKYAIPVSLLVAGLHHLQEPVPQEPQPQPQ